MNVKFVPETKLQLELLLKNRFGPMVEVRVDWFEGDLVEVSGRFEVTVRGRFETEAEGCQYVFNEALRINKELP
jgi:hypothetical protein